MESKTDKEQLGKKTQVTESAWNRTSNELLPVDEELTKRQDNKVRHEDETENNKSEFDMATKEVQPNDDEGLKKQDKRVRLENEAHEKVSEFDETTNKQHPADDVVTRIQDHKFKQEKEAHEKMSEFDGATNELKPTEDAVIQRQNNEVHIENEACENVIEFNMATNNLQPIDDKFIQRPDNEVKLENEAYEKVSKFDRAANYLQSTDDAVTRNAGNEIRLKNKHEEVLEFKMSTKKLQSTDDEVRRSPNNEVQIKAKAHEIYNTTHELQVSDAKMIQRSDNKVQLENEAHEKVSEFDRTTNKQHPADDGVTERSDNEAKLKNESYGKVSEFERTTNKLQSTDDETTQRPANEIQLESETKTKWLRSYRKRLFDDDDMTKKPDNEIQLNITPTKKKKSDFDKSRTELQPTYDEVTQWQDDNVQFEIETHKHESEFNRTTNRLLPNNEVTRRHFIEVHLEQETHKKESNFDRTTNEVHPTDDEVTQTQHNEDQNKNIAQQKVPEFGRTTNKLQPTQDKLTQRSDHKVQLNCEAHEKLLEFDSELQPTDDVVTHMPDDEVLNENETRENVSAINRTSHKQQPIDEKMTRMQVYEEQVGNEARKNLSKLNRTTNELQPTGNAVTQRHGVKKQLKNNTQHTEIIYDRTKHQQHQNGEEMTEQECRDKKNHLELYLNEVYDKKCKFKASEEEVEFIQKGIESLVQKIVDLSLDAPSFIFGLLKLPLFGETLLDVYFKSEIIKVGSFYEGTKNFFPDEFGFIFPLMLLLEVKYKPGRILFPDPSMTLKLRENLAEELHDIMASVTSQNKASLIYTLPNKQTTATHQLQFDQYIAMHEPASLLRFIFTNSSGERRNIHVDLVPAYLMRQNGREWCESTQLKFKKFPKFVDEAVLSKNTCLWINGHFSSTEAEVHVMKNVLSEKHRRAYQILKYFINGHGDGEIYEFFNPNTNISNHKIKAVVINHHDECINPDTDNIGYCVIRILEKLHQKLIIVKETRSVALQVTGVISPQTSILSLIQNLISMQAKKGAYSYDMVRMKSASRQLTDGAVIQRQNQKGRFRNKTHKKASETDKATSDIQPPDDEVTRMTDYEEQLENDAQKLMSEFYKTTNKQQPTHDEVVRMQDYKEQLEDEADEKVSEFERAINDLEPTDDKVTRMPVYEDQLGSEVHEKVLGTDKARNKQQPTDDKVTRMPDCKEQLENAANKKLPEYDRTTNDSQATDEEVTQMQENGEPVGNESHEKESGFDMTKNELHLSGIDMTQRHDVQVQLKNKTQHTEIIYHTTQNEQSQNDVKETEREKKYYKNNLEVYLTDVYDKKCKLNTSEEELEFIQKGIESLVQTIVDLSLNDLIPDADLDSFIGMENPEEVYFNIGRGKYSQIKTEKSEIIMVGSFYEKTKNFFPDEFGFIFPLMQLREETSEKGVIKPSKYRKTFAEKIHHIIADVTTRKKDYLIHTFPNEQTTETRKLHFDTYIVLSKPASFLRFIYTNNREDRRYIHVDLVPAYKIIPNNMESSLGTRLKFKKYPKFFNEAVLSKNTCLWINGHFSFTEAEVHVMKNVLSEKHRNVYQILKFLINGHGDGEILELVPPNTNISNHKIKTMVIIHHDECTNRDTDYIGDCVIKILEKLHQKSMIAKHTNNGSIKETSVSQSSQSPILGLIQNMIAMQASENTYRYDIVRMQSASRQLSNDEMTRRKEINVRSKVIVKQRSKLKRAIESISAKTVEAHQAQQKNKISENESESARRTNELMQIYENITKTHNAEEQLKNNTQHTEIIYERTQNGQHLYDVTQKQSEAKTNNLELYLDDVYDKECKLKTSKEEVEFIQKGIETLVQKIVDLSFSCPYFQKGLSLIDSKDFLVQISNLHENQQVKYERSEIIKVGSFYEGTKNNYPDEFDFICPLLHREKTIRKELHLEPINEGIQDILIARLLPLMRKAASQDKDLIYTLPSGQRKLNFDKFLGFHGPAFMLRFIYINSSGDMRNIHVDLVPALRITPDNMIKALEEDFCPKPFPNFFRNEVVSKKTCLQVGGRLSFTETEVHVMKNVLSDKHRKVYQILKFLINGHGDGEVLNFFYPETYISSNKIKRVMFHHHEECSKPDTGNVGYCVVKVLIKLTQSTFVTRDITGFYTLPPMFQLQEVINTQIKMQVTKGTYNYDRVVMKSVSRQYLDGIDSNNPDYELWLKYLDSLGEDDWKSESFEHFLEVEMPHWRTEQQHRWQKRILTKMPDEKGEKEQEKASV